MYSATWDARLLPEPDSLNITRSPGWSSSFATGGKVVETQGFQDGWYKIESGYISAEYVVQADPAQATTVAFHHSPKA